MVPIYRVNKSKNMMDSIKSSVQKRENAVLQKGHRKSGNFFGSDLMLRHQLERLLGKESQNYMFPVLDWLGETAALEMDELSMTADKEGPRLVKRNYLGEHVDRIVFHPAYDKLLEIAVRSRMMHVKWEPSLHKRFLGQRHAMGFGAGYLFAMAESGQYCPLCMTDGVALLIHRFCTPEDVDRLLPKIATLNAEDFYTGAMFLTEKAGGSDVGANLVRAEQVEGNVYKLNGEKWFCSNANAEVIFALARTNPEVDGTRGLSIFLVEPNLPDGTRNSIEFVRLKDKLGVRSMASAECIFHDARAILVGKEFEGFRIMAEMINLSRLYNSVAALSAGRRALVESWQFLNYRTTFGKTATQHALVRDKLLELGSLNVANFYLTWRAIEALDLAEKGNQAEAQLLRLLTPMVKKWSAEKGVYIVRESMELMGGMGYIEDSVMPKLMRDVMVLPIWEGAGNIMILDMMRAAEKSEGLSVMAKEISIILEAGDESYGLLSMHLEDLHVSLLELRHRNRDEMEFLAKRLFGRLTTLYKIALLLRARDAVSYAWIDPALEYLVGKFLHKEDQLANYETIRDMMAWNF